MQLRIRSKEKENEDAYGSNPKWIDVLQDENLKNPNLLQEPKRADSGGPAPAAGIHSSGGSLGAHSYRTVSVSTMAKSRTQPRNGIMST